MRAFVKPDTKMIVVLISICLFPLASSFAQVDSLKQRDGEDSESKIEERYFSLPMGFSDIILGAKRDVIVERLREMEMFVYREEPELSFLPSSKNRLMRIEGKKFLNHATFQFDDDDKLVRFSLSLNTKLLDYFGVYNTYQKKYGRAHSIFPGKASWENDSVKITITSPLEVHFSLAAEEQLGTVNEKGEKQKRKEREAFLSLF